MGDPPGQLQPGKATGLATIPYWNWNNYGFILSVGSSQCRRKMIVRPKAKMLKLPVRLGPLFQSLTKLMNKVLLSALETISLCAIRLQVWQQGKGAQPIMPWDSLGMVGYLLLRSWCHSHKGLSERMEQLQLEGMDQALYTIPRIILVCETSASSKSAMQTVRKSAGGPIDGRCAHRAVQLRGGPSERVASERLAVAP